MSGFSYRHLGKTNLQVSPLGIGGGQGIASEDVLYAFERGINYFFFSSDLHHSSYRHSAAALRRLCGRGAAVRDQVVLSTVSYVNDPEKIYAILLDQFAELEIDYIDVFHWGWVVDDTKTESLFKTALQLKEADSVYTKNFRAFLDQAQAVNQQLVKRGLARFAAASFHSRQMARQGLQNLDVVMLRYNIAHLGAETEVFPYLSGNKQTDPGIVAFNVGHHASRLFDNPPPGYPSDLRVPSIPDCYRFALSNPAIDLVLTGLTTRDQIDQALAALEKGPLSAAECAFMRDYGAMHSGRRLAKLSATN